MAERERFRPRLALMGGIMMGLGVIAFGDAYHTSREYFAIADQCCPEIPSDQLNLARNEVQKFENTLTFLNESDDPFLRQYGEKLKVNKPADVIWAQRAVAQNELREKTIHDLWAKDGGKMAIKVMIEITGGVFGLGGGMLFGLGSLVFSLPDRLRRYQAVDPDQAS